MPEGQYNASGVTLKDQQYSPLQLDANGNLKTTGASGSGSTAPSASTGSPSTQAVPVQDAATGASLIGASPSTNSPATNPGSGILGWLGGIYKAITSTLTVSIQNTSLAVTGQFYQATQPVSGTVTATQGTSPWVVSQTTPSPQDASAGTVTALATTAVSTSSVAIVPTATGTRWRATIYNIGSTVIWARADGGTAVVGTGIPIQPGAAYEWLYPFTGAALAPAINAISTASGGSVAGEYVQ